MTFRWLVPTLIAATAMRLPAQVKSATVTVEEMARIALFRAADVRASSLALAAAEGARRTARGPFDVRLLSGLHGVRTRDPLTALGADVAGTSGARSDVYGYSAGASWLLPSGLEATPTVTLTRAATVAPSAVALAPSTDAQVGLQLTQPLLAGFGRNATMALARAAEHGAWAARARLDVARAAVVHATAAAYWRYGASSEERTIARDGEERARRLLREMETLVTADQRPPSDLFSLRADVADKAAAVVRADRALAIARLELGRTAGLTAPEATRLPAPALTLPEAPVLRDSLDVAVLVALAQRHRAEVLAARAELEAAGALRDGAEQARRKRLDLQVGAGYSGRDAATSFGGWLSPLSRNVSGANLSVGLRWESPLHNDAFEGAYAERQALWQERALEATERARTIAIEVEQAAIALQGSLRELALAIEARDQHRLALVAERRKLQQGLSTLINVLLYQDRLQAAESQLLASRLGTANAALDLRLATGTLLAIDGVPTHATLTTIPTSTSP